MLFSLLFATAAWASEPNAPKAIELPLVLGISRTVSVESGIGTIVLPDPSKLIYRRLQEKSPVVRKLLVIPKALGATELVVNDPRTGTPAFRFRATVVAPSPGAIATQKRLDRESGLDVQDVPLPVGAQTQLELSRAIGTITLTDPSIVLYRRIGAPNVATTLWLSATKTGVTDLAIYDTQGSVQRKLYVDVAPKP